MKNSVEHILNRLGWKTVNGKVEYRGFEHKLNADLPDWSLTDFEPPAEADASTVEYLAKSQETHNELLEAQKRVDKLKTRLKK